MKTSWNGKALFVFAVCLFFAQIALAQRSTVAPRITAAVDETKRVTLTGNTHPLAQAQFDRGAAPDSLPLERLMLVLKRSPQQEAALRTLLDEQQDRSSPNFHKWLTPEQFGQQFGPADADIQIVQGWLESHGFRVTNVTKGRTVIEFSGTPALVRQAFHTEIHKFVVNGEQHWANTKDPEIPAAIAPVVGSIKSLHSFFKKPMHVVVKSNASVVVRRGPNPAVNFTDGSHAMVPGDFATIYNVKPLYTGGTTGAGRTIGVIGRSNINLSDVSDFRSLVGLPANTPTVVLNGPDPGDLGGGEEIEALLDNQWSGGVGQGATVKFVISESTETVDGVDLSELYIVDNDLADVMTESFSLCELALNNDINNGQVQFDLLVSEQAAAQGITFSAATGDAGAAGCDNAGESSAKFPASVGLPASTPFTTAVGGTQFDENGDNTLYWAANNGADLSSAKSYIPEEVWNESCSMAQCGNNANLAAGGGGPSAIFDKPAFQSGVTGIPSDGHRDIPDISFSASGHDGYVICQGGSCAGASPSVFVVAGTSAGTPSFAGIMSLVDQKTNSRQGLANIMLYRLAAGETFANCNASTLEPGTPPAGNCDFNDVTVGNNSVPGDTGFNATTGYDRATGLGSANVQNLVNNWAGAIGKTSTTTLSLSASTVTHGTPVMASGTVTGSGGTPTGDVAFVANGTSVAGSDLVTLSGGAYTNFPIPDLPGGGPYNVVAKYSGDTAFAGSTSNGVSVTVTPEDSTTTISAINGNSGNPLAATVPAGTLIFLRVDVAGSSGQGVPTGTVTLTDADANDGATLTLNSFGFAELQTKSLPSGSHSFSATYSSDASFNASSTAAPAAFTISGGGSFSVSADPTSMSVAAGSPATTTVTATGSGGFAGTVTLTEVVAGPNGAVEPPTCAFSPANTIALTSSTTSDHVSMTCSSQAKSQVPFVRLRGPNRPVWLGVSAALALLCIFVMSLPMQKRRWTTAFALVVLAAATAVAGCGGGGGGGGGGNPGTTPGTYTVTITGTSGAAHTATFTITVQ